MVKRWPRKMTAASAVQAGYAAVMAAAIGRLTLGWVNAKFTHRSAPTYMPAVRIASPIEGAVRRLCSFTIAYCAAPATKYAIPVIMKNSAEPSLFRVAVHGKTTKPKINEAAKAHRFGFTQFSLFVKNFKYYIILSSF